MESKDLEEIKTKLIDLNNRLERFIELQQVHHEHIASLVQRHDRTLYGNGGDPGLKVRIDRIETSAKFTKIIWSTLMAGLGAIGTFLIGFFQWKD